MTFWQKSKPTSVIERLAEERLYELVMREIESGKRRDGLWLKALENSRGDERQARVLYIRYRVQSMRDEAAISSVLRDAESADLYNSLNGYSPTGHTPLMLAVLHQDVEQVKSLLARGADPLIKDNNLGTTTALDMARFAHRRASVESDRSKLQEIIDAFRA